MPWTLPDQSAGNSPSRTRTYDHSINSRALYQLSYRGSVRDQIAALKNSLGRVEVNRASALGPALASIFKVMARTSHVKRFRPADPLFWILILVVLGGAAVPRLAATASAAPNARQARREIGSRHTGTTMVADVRPAQSTVPGAGGAGSETAMGARPSAQLSPSIGLCQPAHAGCASVAGARRLARLPRAPPSVLGQIAAS